MNKMKTLLVLGLLGSALFSSSPSMARMGIAFSSGAGEHLKFTPYRGAFVWDFGAIWCGECSWNLDALWETSGAYWDGHRGSNNGNDELFIGTTGPLLRLGRAAAIGGGSIYPYFELGLGAAWFSEKGLSGRTFSTHFQFEDNVGVGFRFGNQERYDLIYRFFHYSNCSIEKPNPGVNAQMISVGVWFG